MSSRVLLTNKQTRIWFSKDGENRLAWVQVPPYYLYLMLGLVNKNTEI